MSNTYTSPHRYSGTQWLKATLPTDYQLWWQGESKSLVNESDQNLVQNELSAAIQRNPWRWPKCPIIFLTDLHADADAFFDSLIASGGIEKIGKRDNDFCLTTLGQKALFLMGGDCLDKGPSNLRLLRAIQLLRSRGARVRHLAGNHDVRIMLGMCSVGAVKDSKTEHLFIRMGAKIVPFLKEIADEYLQNNGAMMGIPDEQECQRRLYPQSSWYKRFSKYASPMMSDKAIDKELHNIQKKQKRFEQACQAIALSMRTVYAAALKWRELFLNMDGEFYWFFDEMRLVYQKGSFLFLHAGLDDQTVSKIVDRGIKGLNREAKELLYRDPFDFYYGPIANTIRTKYRDTDYMLSQYGVDRLHAMGIHVIVHGHNNRYHGQRMTIRKGMVNFECDASLDQATRKKEGLKGCGAAATLFFPDGVVMGISSDYNAIKVFEPSVFMAQINKTKVWV